MAKEVVLLSDVGGTNARFALYKEGQISRLEKFKYSEQKKPFNSFGEIVDLYLSKHPDEKITMLVAGTAGNIVDNKVESASNIPLKPDMDELKERYGLKTAKLVNDFILQGMAIPELGVDEYEQIRMDGYPIVVPSDVGKKGIIGPGTGLGNCRIKRKKLGDRWDYDAAEAGQNTVPELLDTDLYSKEERGEYRQIRAKLIEKTNGPLTIEKWVSGRGLENVYEALLEIYGEQKPTEGISSKYVTDTAATEITRRENCQALGRFEDQPFLAIKAHDYVFSLLAAHTYNMITANLWSEVFLVGGVMADPAIRSMMKRKDSVFFKTLHEKMPKIMGKFVGKVPVYASVERDIAFKGLKLLADQEIAKVNAKEERELATQKAQENKRVIDALAILGALAETDEAFLGKMVKLSQLVQKDPKLASQKAQAIISEQKITSR